MRRPARRCSIRRSANSPIVGNTLQSQIHGLHRSSVIGLVVGVLGLLWGSTGLAQSGLFSMSQIWNLPGPDRPNFVARLGRSFGFLAVLGLGIVVTTGLASFGTFGRHNIALGILAELLAVGVNVATYFGAFRVLTPKVVHSRQLVPGAILGGVLWTILLSRGWIPDRARPQERQRDLRGVRARAGSGRVDLPGLPRSRSMPPSSIACWQGISGPAAWSSRLSPRRTSARSPSRPPRTSAGLNRRYRSASPRRRCPSANGCPPGSLETLTTETMTGRTVTRDGHGEDGADAVSTHTPA